ncbi:MAG TPA: hypothetical protein PK669_13445 [Methanosarcina thermophila]|jgi:hypothetical protein|nr:hypothetical protein [Methanosarcina thermophila]HOA70165.1 hypothetical protein [Methanosarcina thermophila]HOQ66634.1 hypothetical protein [Methanosarcina thermophila]HPT81667.1 hypothetical protein [Methanosarcina thermophila]HPZ21321.1 hypothetical protein [Methanosarcina thermophila]HQD95674.1 hypothetical protein [Methanosarcina thermophila]
MGKRSRKSGISSLCKACKKETEEEWNGQPLSGILPENSMNILEDALF